MSLAPGEQRTLAEIESRFGRSDPGFVAMFALLGGADARKWPACELPPPRTPEPPGHLRALLVLAASATLLIACVAMAVAVIAHEAPAGSGHGAGVSPVGAYFP